MRWTRFRSSFAWLLLSYFVFEPADVTGTGSQPCNIILSDQAGLIKSPGYPLLYSHLLNCSWQIKVKPGFHIVLTTKKFDLESSYNCENDALYIYDGPDEKAPLVNKPYCGALGPTVSSSKNSMFIRFITDSFDNAVGFLIQYNAVKTCYQTFNLTSGWFTSPGYPGNYEDNADCTYRLITEKDKSITLRFEDFALETKANAWTMSPYTTYCQVDSGCYPKIVEVEFPYNDYYYCHASEFKCENGLCVPLSRLCNRINDCLDNSDEKWCSCKKHEFECANSRCVGKTWICDGYDDCGDGSDEKSCQSVAPTKMPTGTKSRHLVVPTKQLVATRQVPRKAAGCHPSDFQCRNNLCIVAEFKCNGINDCGDNSDEKDCEGQCRNWNGGCAHICSYDPSHGSKCSCRSGFSLNADQKTCSDIDECASRPCQKLCMNTYGSFHCACPPGYRLLDGTVNCTDLDECSLNNGGCEQRCVNSFGSYVCACFDGFSYHEQTKKCIDVNECDVNNGGCAEKCVNSLGSFHCSCDRTGFKMESGKTTCTDIDECALGIDDCDYKCTNTNGSYECSCPPGFVVGAYNPTKCRDIDECVVGVAGCWGECVNTLGSFHCKCDGGFREVKNRTACEDIDECATANGGCSSKCVNSVGSFSCQCYDGYVARDSRSFTCEDVDECQQKPCDHLCVNIPGSFRCLCPKGFDVVNKTGCVDVNECLLAAGRECRHGCLNTIGSYKCTCPAGYVLHGDGRSCFLATDFSGCQRAKLNITSLPMTEWSQVKRDDWGWQVSLSTQLFRYQEDRTAEPIVSRVSPIRYCMGVLISDEYVLVPAHCVAFYSDASVSSINARQLLVHLGSTTVHDNSGPLTMGVRSVHIHPEFMKSQSMNFALAMLRLARAVEFTQDIQPACLPNSDSDMNLGPGDTGVVVSFDNYNTWNRHLLHLLSSNEPLQKCMWDQKAAFSLNDTLCAHVRQAKKCLLTSGAALMMPTRGAKSNQVSDKWMLAGFNVRGRRYMGSTRCHGTYEYMPFSKVTSFITWILEIMKIKPSN